METRPTANDPKQSNKLIQIVAGALAATTLIHLYLAHVAVEKNKLAEGLPESFAHPSAAVFGIFAVITLVVAMVLPDILIAGLRRKKAPGKLTVQDLFSPLIIRYALFEAVSIFGFIVGSGSTDLNFSYIATGAALAGYVVFFPTEGRLRQTINLGE